MDERLDLYSSLKDKIVILETKEADIKLRLLDYKREREVMEYASSSTGGIQIMPGGRQRESLIFEVIGKTLKVCQEK
jgi:hypothetical protein